MTEPHSDAHERLALLASAIAGRPLVIRTAGDGTTYTDGTSVFLGSGVEDGAIEIAVQGALLAAGSLDPSVVRRLVGRAAVARRFITLEAARAVSTLHWCMPTQIVAVIGAQWDGPLSATAEESVERALSREEIPDPPESFGRIRPRVLLANAEAVSSAPSEADRRGETKFVPMPELPEDEEESEALPMFLRLLSSGAKVQNPFFKMMRSIFGMGSAPSTDDTGNGEELPVGGARAVERGSLHAKLSLVRPALSDPPNRPTGGISYPEWDSDRGCYRPDWCLVSEFAPGFGDADDQFLARPDVLLRRKLARLALGRERHGRQADGEDLDAGALVDYAVTRSTGESADDRVYQARLQTGRDLGVLVLIDASGSTAEHDHAGRAVWDQQRQLAARLIAGLEEVGDRVAAYGFNSRGRHSVRLLKIKGFEERFTQKAVGRLTALEPSGFTRMGAAIRHAMHLLSTQAGTNHLILVIVSDGFPYDDDYQHGYAEGDTTKAISECFSLGAGCVCLSVASAAEDTALDRLWGDMPHARLRTAGDLGQHIEPLLRSAVKNSATGRYTASAGRQRTS